MIPTGDQTGYCYEAQNTNNNGISEPVWPTEIGETVLDGAVIWECVRFNYRLEGLKRAQYGTSAATLPIGSQVFIFESSQVTQLTGALVKSGESISVKSIPQTTSQVVAFSAVTAKTGTV
ncbi:MAG: hypothetical protein AAF085_14625 [Planctomycetota bacterium]